MPRILPRLRRIPGKAGRHALAVRVVSDATTFTWLISTCCERPAASRLGEHDRAIELFERVGAASAGTSIVPRSGGTALSDRADALADAFPASVETAARIAADRLRPRCLDLLNQAVLLTRILVGASSALPDGRKSRASSPG